METCPAHPLRKHFYWQTRYTGVRRRHERRAGVQQLPRRLAG